MRSGLLFHIPSGNGKPKTVYIEYWGMEYDEKYNEKSSKKIEIYNQLDLILIRFNDADIKNIEDSPIEVFITTWY